jgi:putative transcriptional regulator
MFIRKKVPPPTPDGREGRLFPPEHSWKTGLLLPDLVAKGNKILTWAEAIAQLARGACIVEGAGILVGMRDLDGNGQQTLTGSLLVAHPNMLDPNFRRTVLFISAHDANDGALGVIINRPLEKYVADVMTETPPAGLGDVPVFLGGPVGKDQLIIAAFEWQKGTGLKLNHNVELEAASQSVEPERAPICAYVGYAGWEAGQLEAELKQKAWLVQKPSRSILQFDRLPQLWFDIMRGLGPWYKMLAAAPDDPSLN